MEMVSSKLSLRQMMSYTCPDCLYAKRNTNKLRKILCASIRAVPGDLWSRHYSLLFRFFLPLFMCIILFGVYCPTDCFLLKVDLLPPLLGGLSWLGERLVPSRHLAPGIPLGCKDTCHERGRRPSVGSPPLCGVAALAPALRPPAARGRRGGRRAGSGGGPFPPRLSSSRPLGRGMAAAV